MRVKPICSSLVISAITLLLSGCGLYALGGLWGEGTPLSTSAGEPAMRAVTLSGSLHVPANLAAQGDLGSLPAMSLVNPLAGAAMIATYDPSSAYRIQAMATPAPPLRWDADGRIRGAMIEVVDSVTGEVVGTGWTDAHGRYEIRAFARGANRTGFILQARFKNTEGQTTGILAAPVAVRVLSADTKRVSMDVSAGTTLLTFASLLMSERYQDLTLSEGFAGMKSPRLARLIAELDSAEAIKASKVLDRGKLVLEAPSFDHLLANLATSSAMLTFEVKKASHEAAGRAMASNEEELAYHAAVLGQTLGTLVMVTERYPASASVNLFGAAASLVKPEGVREKAGAIQQNLAPESIPPLPPAPTPTPGNLGIELQ
ncbi:hypothetical protein D3C87_413110 [compost metagenome]